MAMAMQRKRGRRTPLTAATLEEMALNYVGRFATSRGKLRAYLDRKLRERGWAGSDDPPVGDLADRLAALGYVNDQEYALSKARSLTGRGYGVRRVEQALALAGIDEEGGAEARRLAERAAVESALRFARKRGIGPYASEEADRQQRERSLGAMVRAGHRMALARAIVELKPGESPDMEAIGALC